MLLSFHVENSFIFILVEIHHTDHSHTNDRQSYTIENSMANISIKPQI